MPESVVLPQLDVMPISLSNGSGGEQSLELGTQQNGHTSSSNHQEVSENGCSPPVESPRATARDSAWLQVEVCRDFRRDTCPRGEFCRFAHPEAKIIGKDGKVTCCYDFLKGRCKRDFCKYYHPPPHIKEKLINAGKQFGAMMMKCTPPMQPVPPPLQMMPDGCGLNQVASYYAGGYTNRFPICQDFLVGQCFALMCPFAHPGPFVNQNADQTVTVCRNFVGGMCLRGERCRYYHPLAHHFPIMSAIPAPQGFIGQPQLVPVMSPPPQSVIPMGVQFPFSPPVTPGHIPVSLATASSFMPSVPVMPMVSPLPASTMASIVPAQPVTPVSIIETSTHANVVSVQGSGELTGD